MGPQSAVDREFVYIDFFLFCVFFGSRSLFLLLSSFFLPSSVFFLPSFLWRRVARGWELTCLSRLSHDDGTCTQGKLPPISTTTTTTMTTTATTATTLCKHQLKK